jgi:hypothetical protein
MFLGPQIISPQPLFSSHFYERMLNTEKDKRIMSGKMTFERAMQVNSVTNDAISSMHK